MTNIDIADITLRQDAADGSGFSFKEKIDIAKQLDRLNINVIETAPITNGKTDILYLHTIAPIVKNSVISCPVSLTEESVETTYDAIKNASKSRLCIPVPVSAVQMEYVCHKKPDKMIELIESLTKKAASLCSDVEVSMLDATRAEEDFLSRAIETAINCGASVITVCDSAGTMLPAEFEDFLTKLRKRVPQLDGVTLSVECSDELGMGTACAVSCIGAGVAQIKTTMVSDVCPSLMSVAKTFKAKADSLGIRTSINMTLLENSVKQMNLSGDAAAVTFGDDATVPEEDFALSSADDINTVRVVTEKMGYELSDDDIKRVHDEIGSVGGKKKIGAKELDAIIASVAMQVAPTYRLKSYVMNNGNIITPTAQIELETGGETKHGFCIGDGPVDAAFLAIEQITGHHYELDDFQIRAVTEGREALGESIVKLRSDGKLFSGRGISTDIVGASINAYINALNKICFEESEN